MFNSCSIPNCPHCTDWDNSLKVNRVIQLSKKRGTWQKLLRSS